MASLQGHSLSCVEKLPRVRPNRCQWQPQHPDFSLSANGVIATSIDNVEVVANCDHLAKLKFSKVLPHAFTEHGAIQAANVLASPQAVEMGIFVVRAFVRMREMAVVHSDLAKRLSELEQKTEGLALTQDTFSRNTRNQLRDICARSDRSFAHSLRRIARHPPRHRHPACQPAAEVTALGGERDRMACHHQATPRMAA